jgi:hypothetical protein
MNEIVRKLSMYPATYQIKVPGQLDPEWINWSDKLALSTDCLDDGQPVTILTGTIDQAALHGLLRRLYAHGLPLISVTLVDK